MVELKELQQVMVYLSCLVRSAVVSSRNHEPKESSFQIALLILIQQVLAAALAACCPRLKTVWLVCAHSGCNWDPTNKSIYSCSSMHAPLCHIFHIYIHIYMYIHICKDIYIYIYIYMPCVFLMQCICIPYIFHTFPLKREALCWTCRWHHGTWAEDFKVASVTSGSRSGLAGSRSALAAPVPDRPKFWAVG